ncbi:hypothetical protein SGHV043 [Glossina pallidipes salivary gland hypertrophy virus]|uniref:Uncharacterized protein n=1 Tax=Glossina hytrovirus (isolate Glossina pallidipes/Ethiopia/Seibersdorf/-) TaxID=379529 RepID=B0YLJ7_GHVS|nr:hypothetical protein SGHV043 [Glossina pallidipes salivary gland hypertrophy virus]ABQ08816.1 hypothetical protein SGHV043 [Glossina pallidipes salivary gland hypertrophy virus]
MYIKQMERKKTAQNEFLNDYQQNVSTILNGTNKSMVERAYRQLLHMADHVQNILGHDIDEQEFNLNVARGAFRLNDITKLRQLANNFSSDNRFKQFLLLRSQINKENIQQELYKEKKKQNNQLLVQHVAFSLLTASIVGLVYAL